MSAPSTVVVVGAGLAGGSAVGTLRQEGFEGRIVLVGAEHHLPYERPPLSKGYLAGTATLESAFVHAVEFYEVQDVDLRLGTPATALDLEARTVRVGDEAIGWDRLLLATGATPRRLPPVDRSGAEVAYLRTIEDAERIRSALQPGHRIVVVGGGWIGLEVAAAARGADCEVVVVEPLTQPLLRVLGPEIAEAFAALHRRHGVDLRTSTGLTSVTTRDPGGPAVVHLDDGTAVEADLIVVGIGVVPSTELASSAGLAVQDGVLADEYLTTGHPDVLVAGDIARAHHPALGTSIRVEHWDNAKAQGATAARNLLGTREPYDRLPYFFTDQYDLGMEYIGVSEAYDEVVVRGDLAGVYTAFWVRDGRVRAAMHVNDWDATDALRAIVTAGTVDLAVLRDPKVPLGELVP